MRWRWFLDYLAAWQTLILNRNWGDFCAIYRARRAFKKWLPQFQEDRVRIQQGRKVNSVAEQKTYAILWQYYVRGRRRFSLMP